MAINGISTNRLCESSGACLKAQGKNFVFRYYSRTTQQPEKQLRPREAAELARADIDIAVVYQDNARETGDFGFGRGRLDGASAFAAAGQIGQPAGTAIYFAVDTDFSQAEVRQFVVPYFKGAKEAMDAASGGTSIYRMGVYGSGLTCRLLDEAKLVEFKWLAEATGWRESRNYNDWDVKQFVTDQNLCDISNRWQRCEAKGDFGGFRPVGFELRAGEGVSMRVSASVLNLRFVPTSDGNEPIARVPHGTLVRVLGDSAPGWVRVRVVLNGATFIGHVRSSFLEPAATIPPQPPAASAPALTAIPAAHFREGNPNAKRSGLGGMASPIGEAGRPARSAGGDAAAQVAELTAIGDWLEVSQSARYAPRDGKTYCNVYAADYCYLAGVYLPRVWWTGGAIARIARGEQVPVAPDDTVREMRADDLYRWLLDFGSVFGWRRVSDATALQNTANDGGVGIVCADREAAGRPGHITVVVPEDPNHSAVRDAAGNVDQPLQSQAGSTNFRYGSAGRNWWKGQQFIGHVFFVHD
ncbi:DUF1906 domain-containing protein [Variovorax sp. LjRoot290]|uniref:glycoside hydrolase domain-containing protein n=1 Tax=Variovorax sp. LjRoot290 TaxID=3342316 RepID=UPI003ED15BD4